MPFKSQTKHVRVFTSVGMCIWLIVSSRLLNCLRWKENPDYGFYKLQVLKACLRRLIFRKLLPAIDDNKRDNQEKYFHEWIIPLRYDFSWSETPSCIKIPKSWWFRILWKFGFNSDSLFALIVAKPRSCFKAKYSSHHAWCEHSTVKNIINGSFEIQSFFLDSLHDWLLLLS